MFRLLGTRGFILSRYNGLPIVTIGVFTNIVLEHKL